MTEEVLQQFDAFVTPGTLLKTAREAQEISEREAADRLNMMPGYVAILERDDYDALRVPAFARGYVKAYGKMLGLDEEQLLSTFDQLRASKGTGKQARVRVRPLQLQRTGLGVVISLAILLLLVVALWWLQGDSSAAATGQLNAELEQTEVATAQAGATGAS